MIEPLEISFALADQWDEMLKTKGKLATYWEIAQWGADQELELCIKLLSDLGGNGEMFRRYRRLP